MRAYLFVKLDGVVINIEILSLSFGLARESDAVDLPRAAASTSVTDVTVVVPSCADLLILFRAQANGSHIREAFITCVNKNGKGRILAYQKYRLEDVMVSSFTSSTKETTIGLNFERLEHTYRQG